MTDFPARPLTKQDKKDILAEAISRCREKELENLIDEVEEAIKSRGVRPTIDLLEDILDA